MGKVIEIYSQKTKQFTFPSITQCASRNNFFFSSARMKLFFWVLWRYFYYIHLLRLKHCFLQFHSTNLNRPNVFLYLYTDSERRRMVLVTLLFKFKTKKKRLCLRWVYGWPPARDFFLPPFDYEETKRDIF